MARKRPMSGAKGRNGEKLKLSLRRSPADRRRGLENSVFPGKKGSGRMDLNHRPPGPEISVQNPYVVDSVSLTVQTTPSPLRILHPMLHPSEIPSSRSLRSVHVRTSHQTSHAEASEHPRGHRLVPTFPITVNQALCPTRRIASVRSADSSVSQGSAQV